jgi:hypothetical protein
MANYAICPHCGLEIQEAIPSAVIGTIQLRCPNCGMTFSYQQETEEPILENEDYYFSTGLFRRKPVSNKNGRFEKRSKTFCYLVYLIMVPLVGIGFLMLLIAINVILGWLF